MNSDFPDLRCSLAGNGDFPEIDGGCKQYTVRAQVFLMLTVRQLLLSR